MEKRLERDAFRSLAESAVPQISDYSIGFARLFRSNKHCDAELGGSGTLVTIDDVGGILTAKHVVDALKENAEDVGLILPSSSGPTIHAPRLKLDHCRRIAFPLGADESEGPDLEFLILPPDMLGTLRAEKSFYNLSKRQKRMTDHPPCNEYGFWMLSGMAHEWTSNGPPENGFSKIKVFRGACGALVVSKELGCDEFDYLICEALYNEFYEGPNRFGGYSGGGLWQLLVQSEGENLTISEYVLSGVAFHESGKLTDSTNRSIQEIKCHGRKSLYDTLMTKVRSELA